MKQKREKILELSNQILEDIEMSKIPLSQICLKAKRLSKLSEDEMYQKALDFEISGYPQELFEKLSSKTQEIARFSNRTKNNENGKTVICSMGIEQIQAKIDHYKNVPTKHSRRSDSYHVDCFTKELSERKRFIYNYVLNKNTELCFGNNIESSIDTLIKRIEKVIVKYLPDGVKKLNSAVDNLSSSNPEDWANSTTTFRRILSDLAKTLEPESKEKYFQVLKKYLKEDYKAISEIHIKFIVDETNEGTHRKASRENAEKLLLHMCLFLDEIEWNKVDAR